MLSYTWGYQFLDVIQAVCGVCKWGCPMYQTTRNTAGYSTSYYVGLIIAIAKLFQSFGEK